MKILIVEDELIIALATADTLRQHGHEIAPLARDEPQAMRSAESFLPDLALVDWELARGSTGASVALKLWQQFGIRTIFVSDAVAARRTPPSQYVVGFLRKPFSPEQLLAKVIAASVQNECGASRKENLAISPVR